METISLREFPRVRDYEFILLIRLFENIDIQYLEQRSNHTHY